MLTPTPMPMQVNDPHRLKMLCLLPILATVAVWLIELQEESFRLRHGAPPPDWSWPALILVDIAVFIALAKTGGDCYRDYHTTLTSEGVTQETLLGTRTARWVDVRDFTLIGYMLHLPGPDGRVSVNTAAYIDSTDTIMDRVLGYISAAAGEVDGDEEDIDEGYSSPPDKPIVI